MFTLNKEEREKLLEWQKSRIPEKYSGASGGRWTYTFTPTSLGTVIKVIDNLITEDNELDLTDYDIW